MLIIIPDSRASVVTTKNLKSIKIEKKFGKDEIIFTYLDSEIIRWDWFDNDEECNDTFYKIKHFLLERD